MSVENIDARVGDVAGGAEIVLVLRRSLLARRGLIFQQEILDYGTALRLVRAILAFLNEALAVAPFPRRFLCGGEIQRLVDRLLRLHEALLPLNQFVQSGIHRDHDRLIVRDNFIDVLVHLFRIRFRRGYSYRRGRTARGRSGGEGRRFDIVVGTLEGRVEFWLVNFSRFNCFHTGHGHRRC